MSSNMSFISARVLFIGLFFAAPAVLSAAATVDNISLKKQGEFTEVTIYTSGDVEFDHQIAEPGAGKPYRVVIDLGDAFHKLPQHNFNNLPSETVTSIRTSQYSLNPERIVRVVLDVRGRVTYKVRHDKGAVSILITTPHDAEFPFWCAQPLSEAEKMELALRSASSVSAVSGGETDYRSAGGSASAGPDNKANPNEKAMISSTVLNEGGTGPRIPSGTARGTEPKQHEESSTTTEPKKTTPGAQAPVERQKAESSGIATAILSGVPEIDAEEQDRPRADESGRQSDPGGKTGIAAAILDQLVQSGDREEPSGPVTPVSKSGAQVMESSDGSKSTDKADKLEPGSKHEVGTDTDGREPKTRPTDSADDQAPVLPSLDRTSDSGANKIGPALPGKPLPRPSDDLDEEIYRKNPEGPARTTGTLADRFPKRKVIEYQSWGRRDPFGQLVDKSLSGFDPGEPPNVETLRLVGVLRAPEGASALLEDYDGYGYILKDGDRVQNGHVVQIGEDKIIFQIKEYGWSRTVALRLKTD